jgi:hypothetical protein
MHTLIRTALTLLLTTVALNAHADLKQLGTDFRTMMSNYTMNQAIKQRCPDITLPEMQSRPIVEKAMQNKLGIQNYIQLMMSINKSDDKKNALATVDKLWESIEGCEDPKLTAALGRIAKAHSEAYARFESEPALVKPKDVPVPMRRR